MPASSFRALIEILGQQFGQLDNQVEKWTDCTASLAGYTPQIEEMLADHFEAGSAPLVIFSGAAELYKNLSGEIPARAGSATDRHAASGYLNLRYYIYLNAFLQACAESLSRVGHNPGLDAADLVENSYYTPYFFERVTVSTGEVIAMLEADLARLQAVTRNKKGIVQAFRIRKGVVSTLVESYCPLYPWHYPAADRLGAIKASTDPVVIVAVVRNLEELLVGLKAAD